MAKYEITEDRQITCEGKRIGSFDEAGLLSLEVGTEISGQALGYLKRFIAGEKEPEEEAKRVSVRPMEPSPPPPEIPPEPPQDPRAGDKTPEYAEWLFKFHPDKAAKLYAGRKIMGRQMPLLITPETPIPKAAEAKMEKLGADVPESAMAKEAPEQWM